MVAGSFPSGAGPREGRLAGQALRPKGDRNGTETHPSRSRELRCLHTVGGRLPGGIPARSRSARQDHRPGLGHHQGAGRRGVRHGHGPGERNGGGRDDQHRRPLPVQLPASRHLRRLGRGHGLQEARPGERPAPDERDPRPGHHARGRRPGGGGQRHRREPPAEHLGREHGLHRGPEAHRRASADPRRPVQDHGVRDRPRPLGRPASGPAVRADAHHRVRLRRHPQQPQRPPDRRRAEHLHREPERGHRELRPALGHGPGVQGADRDLRRPVRQHRGGRHQHEHQVRDEPLPRHGLLLRRAEEAGRERLLREHERPAPPRHLLRPARLQPHRPAPHPGPLRREGQDVLLGRLRAHQGRPPAIRRHRPALGPDGGAAQRRLLRVLLEHHDLRSDDAQAHRQRRSSPGTRSPATSSRPTASAPSRRRSWTTTACPRTRAWPGTSTTRPCRRRPTTAP